MAAGLAEVIKYGLIRDVAFLEWCEANMERLMKRDPEALRYAMYQSCKNKSDVVSADERYFLVFNSFPLVHCIPPWSVGSREFVRYLI